MKTLRVSSGQVLLPALALYVTLVLAFFGMVRWGQGVLIQMRMETAAEAAALSVARAQAEVLNKCATHNLIVNGFVNLSYHGMGAMQRSARNTFWFWLKQEQAGLRWAVYSNGLKGYCASVGRAVARLNGADPLAPYYPRPVNFQLEPKDMEVILLKGYIPDGIESFREVYYARQWKQDKRRAQPPHTTAWLAAKADRTAVASARVYLDLKDSAPLHNGGFPRLNERWAWGDLGIQSFYPQFNARLIRTSEGLKRFLKTQHHLRIG